MEVRIINAQQDINRLGRGILFCLRGGEEPIVYPGLIIEIGDSYDIVGIFGVVYTTDTITSKGYCDGVLREYRDWRWR